MATLKDARNIYKEQIFSPPQSQNTENQHQVLHLCLYDVCIQVCACADVYACAFVCAHAGAHLPCAHRRSEDDLRCQPFSSTWFETGFLFLGVENAGLAVP